MPSSPAAGNCWLFTLSIDVGTNKTDTSGVSILSKIKWYDGTSAAGEPADFGNLWNQTLYP